MRFQIGDIVKISEDYPFNELAKNQIVKIVDYDSADDRFHVLGNEEGILVAYIRDYYFTMVKPYYGFNDTGNICVQCGTSIGCSGTTFNTEEERAYQNKLLKKFDNNYCRKCGNKLTREDEDE